MKGKFKVEIEPSISGSLMEALGIEAHRCEELCGLIEDIHEANPELGLSEILSEASKHCQSVNELAFVSFILGKHVGFTEGVHARGVAKAVQSLFNQMMGARATKPHPFSMS